MADFLLEIGCEEIPARMLEEGLGLLWEGVHGCLKTYRLLPSDYDAANEALGFCTPRRIGVYFPRIISTQSDVVEQLTGPSLKVAFKDGKPTPAAEAFAKKAGLLVEQLEKITTPKGEYLSARVTKRGRAAAEILVEALPSDISGIYWPKTMSWRIGAPESFVRPIRWMVAILDDQVIPLEYAGLRADRVTRGHRILGRDLQIGLARSYRDSLRSAKVIAERNEREQIVRKALDAATRAVRGAYWREDPELLNTVVNLTEWPSAILGSFDQEFLVLPEEVLVTVMRHHQKYFAVEDAEHKLLPHFLTVLNTDSDPEGLIRHGNERVLNARFRDAAFFRNFDQRHQLAARVEMLNQVTFQKDLGSYYAKTERVALLAQKIAEKLIHAGFRVDSRATFEAARLAKADLTTELVKEFTELQGIIGGRYAEYEGMSQRVADAIYDQYKPSSMEDSAPRTLEGAVLSIADKADSIAGMFALGLVPSGSKDPFALRRQANGIVKILADHNLPLRLSELIDYSLRAYQGTEAEKKFKSDRRADLVEISQFFRERLQFYLRDVRNFRYDAVNAVLTGAYDRGDDEVPDLIVRTQAVDQIRALAEFEPLFVAFKRIKNIIRQANEKNFGISKLQEGEKFDSDAEAGIWNEFQRLASSYLPLRKQRKYVEAFRELAKVRGPVDLFFEKVMVMVDDPNVRAKRLGLLSYLLETFNTVADLSELAPENK